MTDVRTTVWRVCFRGISDGKQPGYALTSIDGMSEAEPFRVGRRLPSVPSGVEAADAAPT
jgi:hypothetical protein